MLKPIFTDRATYKIAPFFWLGLLAPNLAYAEEFNFNEMAQRCASSVHPNTLQALVRTESSFNPFAIGVVDGVVEQPTSLEQAIETVKVLKAMGKNFSLGLAQINRYNLAKYGLTFETVFDPCLNLKTSQAILTDCFNRAGDQSQSRLQKAFSCYYSGNFKRGFAKEGKTSYVQRVLTAAQDNNPEQQIKIPEVDPNAPMPVSVAQVKVKKQVAKAKAPAREKGLAHAAPATRTKKSWDILGDF